MRKFLGITLCGLLLIFAGWTAPAEAAEQTFKLTNSAPFLIKLRFFSQDRDVVWPSPNGSWWPLDDNAQHVFKLECNSGEKICFGGGYQQDDSQRYWGVGFKGDKGCQDCCRRCQGDSKAWNLVE